MKLGVNIESFWILIGLLGQLAFFLRFFFQWMKSEKKKASVIPVSFWYLSIMGAALILAYAIYRKDPVFILGQCFGIFVYGRNLYFIREQKI